MFDIDFGDRDIFDLVLQFASVEKGKINLLGSDEFDNIVESLEKQGLPEKTINAICDSTNALLLFAENAAGDNGEFDKVLAVKVNIDGEIERVYTPILCQHSGGLSLRIGNNFFPCSQEGKILRCGYLEGEIDATLTPNKDLEITVTWGDDAQNEWRCIGIKSPEAGDNPTEAKKKIRSGAPLEDFLREFKGGNGNGKRITPLKELEESLWEIKGIELPPPAFKFGKYVLVLSPVSGNGDEIRTMGNSYIEKILGKMDAAFSASYGQEALPKLSEFYSGKFLEIISKEEWGSGKTKVNVRLHHVKPQVETEPQLQSEPQPQTEGELPF